MKRLFASGLLALSLGVMAASAEEMSGVITCGKCKKTSAEAADCAKACIKNGTPAIFVSDEGGKVYKIANPDKIGDAVNQKVTVDGEVKGDQLTLASVKPAA
jgi:hypothetical protein